MSAVPIEARGRNLKLEYQESYSTLWLGTEQQAFSSAERSLHLEGILEARGLETSLDNMVRLWLQGRVRRKDQRVRLLWEQCYSQPDGGW